MDGDDDPRVLPTAPGTAMTARPVVAAPGGAPVERPSSVTVRTLLSLSLPAIVVGVASALALLALYAVSGVVQDWLWDSLPDAIGADPNSGWWIFGVLTITGVAVGLVLWLVPGHGGPDSATHELMA